MPLMIRCKKFLVLSIFLIGLLSFSPSFTILNIAQQTSETVKQDETETAESKANKTRGNDVNQWTREEKLANGIVVGVFTLVILALLWRISTKEPEE